MNRNIRIPALVTLLLVTLSCSSRQQENPFYEAGVSQELAQFRKENLENIRYSLFFNLPAALGEPVTGIARISCEVKNPDAFILDFKAGEDLLDAVLVNGAETPYRFCDEHILLEEQLQPGENEVTLHFTSPDLSLNRREDFLYTLLVPDRARTLFPCFDQPDLKARYLLTLEIPDSWEAVANGKLLSREKAQSAGRETLRFEETLPVSTYLFSFVAGRLFKETFSRDGREISIYHRETDPDKVAQCPEIAAEVFDALAWMEDYTAIPYPFAKYDLVIVPGFQFGGMEHVGATLYTDKRMFLNRQPTLNDHLTRSSLIAHETTHMWFGDDVTMVWFNDVWTKEVFANYFASLMVRERYPEVDHRLNFINDYIPYAYEEDRTAGTTAIKQELENLHDAGLVYGHIIYDKSPVVMDMLAEKMGPDAFRSGMRRYLQTYAYGNATWDDLITILDTFTTDDLKSWSRSWVNEKGRPTITSQVCDGRLVISQTDPWKRGVTWPQRLTCLLLQGEREEMASLDFTDGCSRADLALPESFSGTEPVTVLPNTDARAYGLFLLDPLQQKESWKKLSGSGDEVMKASLMINLFENVYHGTMDAETFRNGIIPYIRNERNPLLFSMALKYLGTCQKWYLADNQDTEDFLWELVDGHASASARLQAFRLYMKTASSPGASARLLEIWKNRRMPGNDHLSERDYMSLAYLLAIRLPDQAEEILAEQSARITQPDRKREFDFISPAVSPDVEVRDSVFKALLLPENRTVEPWASEALSLLNHPARMPHAVQYIRPALEEMQEIQRTGDIFFPSDWVKSLLDSHTSPEAAHEVSAFFKAHPDYPVKLGNKIRQQADHIGSVMKQKEITGQQTLSGK